ncbi:alpha/beta fold hydrolase [Isobaculum melis]|uniref:Serine aminopeptidase, S33 n=1 Tax=Isobaculum melis TaxID=142588 RepID=A0A1H9RI83_9LACT|nr:alpha/beta hydrolase [Isobaculum melis]SER72521.1 Serine aminopeptidase, S33 [Isobaculum melis]
MNFFLITMIFIGCILLLIFINRLTEKRQKNTLTPPGQIVDVNGSKMHVYIKGTGKHTLVYLSGGAVYSPVYDAKKLCDRFASTFKVAIVEKKGYGYSDIADVSRDIDEILDDTRLALNKAGLTAPYILVPHSMSGLEAIYWAQTYPNEVEAIIGLDPAVPDSYQHINLNLTVKMAKFLKFVLWTGFGKLINIYHRSTSEKMQNLSLNEEEHIQNKQLMYKNFGNITLQNEAQHIPENVKKINSLPFPSATPMYFFISNAKGTSMKKDIWHDYLLNYIKKIKINRYTLLDCSHFLYNFEDAQIFEKSLVFIESLNEQNQS